MNNWFICWFFTHISLGILIFKGLTARHLYKSFSVKGLISERPASCTEGTPYLILPAGAKLMVLGVMPYFIMSQEDRGFSI
jgi:hypothetical protein